LETPINSWSVKVLFVLLAVCANSVLTLAPALIGALVDDLGTSREIAGFWVAANTG